jgi:hypothetical protein
MAVTSGILSLDMDVFDGTKPVTQVSAGMAARHRVHVKNITQHPVTVIVEAILPNGPARLEFPTSPLRVDGWADIVNRIPGYQSRTLECDLKRNGGPNGNGEPLQCDDVWVKTRVLPWNQLRVNMPYSIAVDAV